MCGSMVEIQSATAEIRCGKKKKKKKETTGQKYNVRICYAGRPTRWALAHISSWYYYAVVMSEWSTSCVGRPAVSSSGCVVARSASVVPPCVARALCSRTATTPAVLSTHPLHASVVPVPRSSPPPGITRSISSYISDRSNMGRARKSERRG